jgi:lipopolysaccharide export system protein LptA
MLKWPLSGPVAVLAVLLVPATVHAQECIVVQSGVTNIINQGTPQQVVYVTVPVITCPGGRRISADNAYISEATGQVQLMGNVLYQDSARTLRSVNATYHSRAQRLDASGNVVLVHRGTNSTIRAEQLHYTEATARRPALVQALGGRPVAVLRQAGQQDSTTLFAQQIDIVGERLRGTGDARLVRDSIVAMAYVIEYDQNGRRMDLSGLRTQIDLPGYQLLGDSITATLTEADEVRDILARHEASLGSEDMDVTAGAIRLFFEDGAVARMVAMPWPPRPGALPAGQARVTSEQFNMAADSVDVLAPQQQLREAVAIGRAFVERITPDSLRKYLPEADEAVLRAIANDWMRGDTVRAFFTAAPADPAAADVTDPAAERQGTADRVLERLYAIGGPAQAMHRMRPEDAAPDAMLSIAYLVGRQVEVTLTDGLVSGVTASEDVRGIYLQPADAARGNGGNATSNRPARRQR